MYFPWYNRLAQHYKNSQACTKKAAKYSMSWQISLTVPHFVLDLFALALEPIVDALSTQVLSEGWLIRGYMGAKPSQGKIATILERTATIAGIQPPSAHCHWPSPSFSLCPFRNPVPPDNTFGVTFVCLNNRQSSIGWIHPF